MDHKTRCRKSEVRGRRAVLMGLCLLATSWAAHGQHGAPPSRVPLPSFPGQYGRVAGSGTMTNPPTSKILNSAGLTKADFRAKLAALRNEQLVDWHGHSLTKLAFLADAGKRISTAHQLVEKSATEHRESDSDLADAELSAMRVRLQTEEKTQLVSVNQAARHEVSEAIARNEVPPCPAPTLGSTPSDPLAPGRVVALFGCGFGAGTVPGTVHLRLATSGTDILLVIEQWSDRAIAATLPDNLTKLGDQAAQLIVDTPAHQTLVASATFRALRDLRTLPASRVQVVSCSSVADANYCNGASQVDAAYWGLLDSSGLGNPVTGTSAGSAHADDASPQDDEGTDTYGLNLHPGWVVRSVNFRQLDDTGGGSATAPAFTAGASAQKLAIAWKVPGEGGVLYAFDVLVIGPRGTEP
jgi:hypothetical protein